MATDEIHGLVERLKEVKDCGDPGEDGKCCNDSGPFCGYHAFNSDHIPLLREAAAALTRLSEERDEAREKIQHWHRRAQQAEAQLCVTAEQRAKEGESIGRRLAGATWHHYKDRAEAAESRLQALEAQIAATKETA